MLELNFFDEEIGRGFELKSGVCWPFCLLSDHLKNYGLEAYFKEDVFVVTNEWITFRALNDRNTIYEVKLSAVEEGKIRLGVPGKKSQLHSGPLNDFEKENKEIDMAAFLKNKEQPEKIAICENVVKPIEDIPYTETLLMEIDRSSDILRFYLTVTYKPQYAESLSESIYHEKTDSRIKTITLDNEVTFDFCNDTFMEIMKKIMNYCERKNVKISICCRDYMVPGHCVNVPHTVVTSDSFEIAFCFDNVREVHVAKNIMNSCYYTDTLGCEYSIGNIVQETQKKTTGCMFIHSYGASNIWKMVFPEDREYIFGCGFSL